MIKKILQGYLGIVFVSWFLASGTVIAGDSVSKEQVAVFAGGCFWCMEPPFDALPGVIKTISGFTGGHTENPSYKEVSNGKTGHSEALQVTYDASKISYEKLLEVFWHNIDPFNSTGQFCDEGEQYKAVIFYADEQQKQLAEASKVKINKQMPDKYVATSIKPAGKFFSAEQYHQDYYLKNPNTYHFYRFTCGRDRRLNKIWNP
ncbi:peptide-methionine (S)-S-oxide reductase MsrA [Crenothrix polyspora]|uniref:Peptide methionine sulfoxide reductase MsrA n=1 Tax=Crenothrix polyspora TaxID=360316 RepID=A0A1R4HK14_9GAMM|nr:peptide-methionine (S)-S-oxide reductase MsrA [Crenothrix polyspora]SJM96559.1 Peptide methionine sulfoxide reductase MsrA [Crenothrix polyspora]